MATTITRKVRDFRDISLMFNANPFTRDIYTKNDAEAIKNSVKNLIMTRNYERPFHPEIGSPVYGLLFENFTPTIKNTLERAITDVIEKFEPRARLIEVNVTDSPDENSLDVRVEFAISNTSEPITVLTTLRRAR